MGVLVTEEAVELLRRSLIMGGVDSESGGVRLRAAKGLGGGIDVQVELADAALPDEATIEAGGIRVFVDPEVTATIPDAIVAVEPEHDRIVVRPAATGGGS